MSQTTSEIGKTVLATGPMHQKICHSDVSLFAYKVYIIITN